MPCTRSMVTRSVSKPSNKGKGRAADEEDMPPPPTSPPKARATRSKKVNKQSSQDSQEVIRSKPSGSTRSTRNRTQSKADQVEEVESNPPSPRPSRSTRQKPSTASKPRSTVEKQLSKQVVDLKAVLSPKPGPVATTSKSTLKPKTEGKTATATTTSKATKRTRTRTKKLESEPEDVSTDAEIEEPKKKNLTLEQLHKHHVLPLKTALSVCEAFPKIMKKIEETDTTERMENEFQQLMNSEDMLPPPVPASKAKGKGRKKRNRSPDEPTTKTGLPMSFNFSENKEDAPAKKRMILDAQTPEIETKTVIGIKDGITEQRSGESSEQETDSAEIEGKTNEAKSNNVSESFDKEDKELPQKQQLSQVAEKKTKKPKTKRVKKVKEESMASDQEKAAPHSANDDHQQEQTVAVDPKPDNQIDSNGKPNIEDSNSTPAIVHEVLDEPQSSDISKDLNSKSEEDGSKSGNTLSSIDSETMKNCHTDSVPKSQNEIKKNDMEKSISPISKLEVDENSIKQTNITPEVCANDGTPSNIRANDNGINTTDSAETKKKPVLEETFVFDTPKEDDKDKATKLNTTYTPELCFSETPKSSRPQQILNETVVISKDSSPACVNEADEDHVLAPESPDSGNINSANGKVHSLVKYFDKQTDKSTTSHDCKADSTDKNDDGAPVENNPNATFVLPPTKKDKHPNPLMNVTVCVKKAAGPDSIKEDSFLPPQKLITNPTSESAASRTFVKEPQSLAVVVEEEDEKNARLSKQNDTNRAVAKPSKDAKKGISSSSSSSGSSMKSAVSQPCLISKHKVATSSKNGPSHGSTGKLHDVHKSKPLEEAERRRQELLNLKVEQQKKKNEEWRKKAEKNNLEEAKKQKEKAKAIQTAASSSSNILKKPHQFAKPNAAADPGLVAGFVKPKTVFGLGPSKMPAIGAVGGPKVLPSLPKAPFQKQPPPLPVNDYEIDESFKSASNSFLDGTMEGHLSSYDITVYEDLDEDLKHRENKTIPKWASDKDALKEALFSMVLYSEYQYKISSGFPKPDKNYRLFPNKHY